MKSLLYGKQQPNSWSSQQKCILKWLKVIGQTETTLRSIEVRKENILSSKRYIYVYYICLYSGKKKLCIVS